MLEPFVRYVSKCWILHEILAMHPTSNISRIKSVFQQFEYFVGCFSLEIDYLVWYFFKFFISMTKWHHQVRNQKQTWKKVFKRILINQYKKFKSNNKQEIIKKKWTDELVDSLIYLHDDWSCLWDVFWDHSIIASRQNSPFLPHPTPCIVRHYNKSSTTHLPLLRIILNAKSC